MSIKVLIPTPLQKLTQGQGEVSITGSTIKDALSALNANYPGIGERLYDEKGALRRFVNFYVNGEDIRFLQGDQTALKAGDELSIVPAIAGGK